jgi:hypothetical protein
MRVAIFIDFFNFTISYSQHHKLPGPMSVRVWDNLNQKIVKYYCEHLNQNNIDARHVGTWLCVGKSEQPEKGEKSAVQKFEAIDLLPGYIVTYGRRSRVWDNEKHCYVPGGEKGVDTEIVCQMLMGAFQDHYDACILLSDDSDFLPVLNRVQSVMGKQVIHAGFQNHLLRKQCYAHIPFENLDKNWWD